MPAPKKILVVDDDAKIRKAVGEALREEGYGTFTAADGPGALEACRRHMPDLIVLDVVLPGMDGFDVCSRLRADGAQVPILMLSARCDEVDKVVGFRLGADDYMTKPFSINELVLRVKAILRRTGGVNAPATEGRISAGPLEMDKDTHRVTMGGRPVKLTPREFLILWLLAVHPGQVLSRETLLERAWASDFDGDETAVTVYIRRLREKLEANPGDPQHLKTVWGIGYKFDA